MKKENEKPRAIRTTDRLWNAAREAVEKEGRTLTDACRDGLELAIARSEWGSHLHWLASEVSLFTGRDEMDLINELTLLCIPESGEQYVRGKKSGD